MNKEPGISQLLTDLFRNIQHLPVATAIITQSGQYVGQVNQAFLQLFNKDGDAPNKGDQKELFPELLHPLIMQVIGNAVHLE